MVQQAMVSDLTLYHDKGTGLDYASDIGETTPVSWQPRGALNYEEWIAIGNTLQQVNASLNWWIGDWLNYGEAKWGEMYAQAVDATGWRTERLTQAKWVAGSVKFSLRKENLTWSHHIEVASLDPDEQAAWLNRAEVEGWSVRRLREEVKGPQLPKLSLSFAEPTEAPFNHRTRTGIPEDERTAVDEYEQQGDGPVITNDLGSYRQLSHDTKQCEQCGQLWAADLDYCPYCHVKPEVRAHYANGTRPSIHFSSDTPEHYTPAEIIDAAIACMGDIDLDPCSNSKTDPNVPAAIHYTQADDGLMQGWQGRIYMNPPYGREIGAWVEKLCAEHKAGNVTEAIALVPARTDTQWFKKLRDYPVCFVEGRLTFIGNEDPAPFPSAVFYLGDNISAFHFSFSGMGDIWQRVEPSMFGA